MIRVWIYPTLQLLFNGVRLHLYQLFGNGLGVAFMIQPLRVPQLFLPKRSILMFSQMKKRNENAIFLLSKLNRVHHQLSNKLNWDLQQVGQLHPKTMRLLTKERRKGWMMMRKRMTMTRTRMRTRGGRERKRSHQRIRERSPKKRRSNLPFSPCLMLILGGSVVDASCSAISLKIRKLVSYVFVIVHIGLSDLFKSPSTLNVTRAHSTVAPAAVLLLFKHAVIYTTRSLLVCTRLPLSRLPITLVVLAC